MFNDWWLELKLSAALRRLERAAKEKRTSSEEALAQYETNLRTAVTKYQYVRRALEKRRSMRLHVEASKLDIDVPPRDDREIWDEEGLNETYLTLKGRNHLRKLIDAEKARRFEVKTIWVTKFWLPLLAALVGIIGALTGLVAVLQHKK
jgi:hypothetical protein